MPQQQYQPYQEPEYRPPSYQQQPYQQPSYQQPVQPLVANQKTINKHIFVWICNFFFGFLGVDRFIRGQIGLGIFKLLVGWWASIGIWPLVDFIISLVKAYGSAFGQSEEIIFINGKYAR